MLVNTGMTQEQRYQNIPPGGPNFDDLLVAIGEDQDREAFVALFEHFAPRIKSFLIKGGLNPDTADELAQETMLTVWNRAGSYKPDRAAASTWIFTIARNKKIDFFRKASGGELPLLETLPIEDSADGPAEHALQREEADSIAEALETLPEEQSALIYKSFFEGKSHGEIADETGIALGTIKSRIRLALDKLRGQSAVRELR